MHPLMYTSLKLFVEFTFAIASTSDVYVDAELLHVRTSVCLPASVYLSASICPSASLSDVTGNFCPMGRFKGDVSEKKRTACMDFVTSAGCWL